MRNYKDSIEWFYADYLTKWWFSSGWPDFSIGDVVTESRKNGGYHTEVEVKVTRGYQIPVDVF